MTRAPAPDLFRETLLPQGFLYEPEFLAAGEEQSLLAALASLEFVPAKFQQYTARRRVVTYGASYDYGAHALAEAPPVPLFLQPLRAKVAAWIGLPARALAYALINEYQPGTPLGWHRDRGEFEVVAGVSLGGPARMRLRRYPPRKGDKSMTLDLEPRSAYVMRGEARWGWQHSIPPTPGLRYSITFRTARTAS
ncbi:MAG: alpha-ketoglutarate-dependent dioxygenase AlkB [Clostridia bacterium]